MADADPLILFRRAISTSTPPVLLTAALEPAPTLPLAAYISFPPPSSSSSSTAPAQPVNLPKDTPTRYTSREGAVDEFYTLAQIWLAWTEREAGVRDYLVKGQAGGSGYVSVADRRDVVEFLSGDGEGAPGRVVKLGQEDATAPQETAASSTVESLPAALDSAAEAGPSKAAPAKRKYEVDEADREFCRKLRAEEIELRDRNSVLRSSNGGKVNNFQPFLQMVMAEKIRALRKSMDASGGKHPAQAQSASLDAARTGPRKAKSSNPIIMISSSPTALITMWNVKRFLESGEFVPSDVARQAEAQVGNTRAEDMIPVLRKRSGPGGDVVNKYYVVDGVDALQKFGQDAWDRVICVLTTGQSWQFRPYKWQDPKTLFRNVKGIYFQWNNEPANAAVTDWNVTEMRIDRNKRHTDRQVVAEFWRILDGARKR